MSLLTLEKLNLLRSSIDSLSDSDLSHCLNLVRTVTESIDLVAWANRHMAHRMQHGLSRFHIETSARLDELVTLRGQHDCELAPRGSAKTTWRTVFYTIREALENREPYILIASDTQKTTRKLFGIIREEIGDNRSLAAAYPQSAGVGPVWNQDEIRLRNGVVIEAASTGEAIRGALRKTRPSLIILDDLQSQDDLISPTLRDRGWEWLTKVILPLGEPRTNIIMNATAEHRESIAWKLTTQPGWKSRVYKSVIAWPANTSLWDEWEQILRNYDNPRRDDQAREFYLQRKPDMDAGAEVLWPERFPIYDLMLALITMGPAAFASEHQNEPANPGMTEWPEDYFDSSKRPEFWFDSWEEAERYAIEVRTLYLDPAKGAKNKQGDYASYIRYARDARGVEWVEADMFRGGADATLDKILDQAPRHVREHRPEAFGFESIQFQSLYGRLLTQRLNNERLDVRLVPMEDLAHKDVRIRRLTKPLAERRMRFKRSPGTMELVRQLRDWPSCDHDDGPDSLEAARRLAILLVNGKVGGRNGQTQFRA